MSEVALRPEPRGELATREAPPGTDLVVWAYEARQAHEIAVGLAGTSFVPKAMQRRPDEVCAAILAGRELGLTPMKALDAIDIIEGRPALKAHTLRGLVQSRGHEIWVEESTSERAIVKGQRRGSSRIESSTWTMDRARKAGLAGKKNWTTHPTAMLVARATSEVARLIAADVLLGMPYSAEELGDGDTAEPTGARLVAVEPKGKRRTLQRAAAKPVEPPAGVDFDAPPPAPAEPEPPQPEELPHELDAIDEGEAVEAEAEPAAPLVTDAQLKRMAVGFRQAGIVERDDRLAFASKVVGRDIDTSKALTVAEARLVIDALVPLERTDMRDDTDRWPEVRRYER